MTDGLVYVTRTPLPLPGIAPLSAAGLMVRQHANERGPTRDELQAELMAADAAIVTSSDVLDEEILSHAPSLKIVASISPSVENIDLITAAAHGIVITNTPDVLTEPTADLAWALILGVARRVIEGDRFMREGKYEGPALTRLLGLGVGEKTIGIIGMGEVGEAVARRARGFGMDILFTSRTLKPHLAEELGAEQTTIVDALRRADVVVITVSLTQDTHHLINNDTLNLMKPKAILVNVSAGPVVDEKALLGALRHRRIGGAGLDVYEGVKVVPGLAELDTVMLTPHIGGATSEARAAQMRLACENVIAVLGGKPASTPVDASR